MTYPAVKRQASLPRRLTAETLRRLSESESTAEPDISGGGLVDADCYFLCPSLTPLWYTPSYAELNEDDRRFYNQLTGLMNIEAIGWFEATFLPALLTAARRLPADTESRNLVLAIERFVEDERNHIRWWDTLHAASCAAIGLSGDSRLLRISPVGRQLMSGLARRATSASGMFWIMLALEEHALEITRRNLSPVTGKIDATHLAAHRDHLRDEARHVQVDWHLIDRFYTTQSTGMRRLNAKWFGWVLERFLLPPVRGAMQVVDRWVAYRPHLAERREAMKQELTAVADDPAYRAMMYSRRATPVLFGLMDQHPEMAGLAERLQGVSAESSAVGVPA